VPASAAAAVSKGRPPRPAFEIQYNTETDGVGAGGPAVRSAPSFAPTGGAFRLIEVSAASGVSPPQKDVDIKVRRLDEWTGFYRRAIKTRAQCVYKSSKRRRDAFRYIFNMKLYWTKETFAYTFSNCSLRIACMFPHHFALRKMIRLSTLISKVCLRN
jgi:hypothetical protein